MTNRERAMNILHYKDVDRMPAVHFGYWTDLLDEWAEQGKIPAEIAQDYYSDPEKERALNKLIGWDLGWGVGASFGCKNGLNPIFEEKVLEVLPDGTRRVQTSLGIIERIKPGISSIPSEDDYQLKDRKAFEELYLPKMQFSIDRIDFEALKKIETADEEHIRCLHVGSILGDVRSMASVLGMSYLIYDEDEDLFADIVDTYAEMQYRCVEEILKTGVKFDHAHYWEDICFKNGPLVSPDTFHELCAKHYKKRNDLLHSYGIDIISLDCDGVIGELIPTWLENGVNTMFPLEVGVWGDQFAPAREKYGKELRGIGGMDKSAFRKDKDAVDAELKRMARLVGMGGFIPCPDHVLLPGSKFELVQYYAEEIKKIKL